MPGRVFRTPAARADLREIAEYLGVENQSPIAAQRFLDEFEEKCVVYANQPRMGDPRTDLGEAIRSFTFKKTYIVINQPLEIGIEVIRVFHGARDYPRLFESP
jgi:toxin ParE1/3/4